jgi:hypothetical protein
VGSGPARKFFFSFFLHINPIMFFPTLHSSWALLLFLFCWELGIGHFAFGVFGRVMIMGLWMTNSAQSFCDACSLFFFSKKILYY